MDKIIIRDLRLQMGIGVYAEEHGRAQAVSVSLEAEVAPPEGGYVCYATMAQGIRAIAAEGHVALVEQFAARIAQLALSTPHVHAVRVRVEKLDALPDAAGVGVEIYRP